MESIRIRNFFIGLIGLGTALTASSMSGNQEDGKVAKDSTSKARDNWFSRRMEEMTSREVEFYLKVASRIRQVKLNDA